MYIVCICAGGINHLITQLCFINHLICLLYVVCWVILCYVRHIYVVNLYVCLSCRHMCIVCRLICAGGTVERPHGQVAFQIKEPNKQTNKQIN